MTWFNYERPSREQALRIFAWLDLIGAIGAAICWVLDLADFSVGVFAIILGVAAAISFWELRNTTR